LFAKRLEKGRFVWPSPADGKVVITPAQLGMLLERIDWRMRGERGGRRLPGNCGKVNRPRFWRHGWPGDLAISACAASASCARR
jgi:hypothetical protein